MKDVALIPDAADWQICSGSLLESLKHPPSSCLLLCFLFLSSGLEGAQRLSTAARFGPYLLPLQGK